jgi:hypothetical protein
MRLRAPHGPQWRTKLASDRSSLELAYHLGGDVPVKQRILLIIAIALNGTTLVHAETEEGRQACMNDAFQFCQEYIPDRERVFRCLEARKNVISAACRANMPAEPAPERPAAKKPAPPAKNAKHNASTGKSASRPVERQTLKKHPSQTKSATAKTPSAKRPVGSTARRDQKPLNLAPAKSSRAGSSTSR